MLMLIQRDDLLGACAEMFPRLGAKSFQMRWHDDPEPVVYIACVEIQDAPLQVAAALTPERAAYRLIEQLVDGGQCQHCGRPTGVELDIDEMPLDDLVCWYQYDPELKVFLRGCE